MMRTTSLPPVNEMDSAASSIMLEATATQGQDSSGSYEGVIAPVQPAPRRNADELAQEVLRFYLEHQARFIEAVKRGLDSLDRGEYVSHAEVGARIDRLFPA
jgi:hypothetical protein